MAALLAAYPAVRHIKIEDGKGKPLGRSFRVKLWPTFILMKDGQVREQLVRPDVMALRQGIQRALTSDS